MEVNFSATKVHSAKRPLYSDRPRSDNTLAWDDTGGDHDDAACWFPCPFCYIEIEITALCMHLQEEHCFDIKNAVCPLCAENLGKDVTGHFMVQHASSLKREKYNHRSSYWNWNGSSFINGVANIYESSPDPLLSSFICGIPFTEHEGFQQDECFNINVLSTSVGQSNAEPSSHCQEDNEERRQRVTFVQELIASTIF